MTAERNKISDKKDYVQKRRKKRRRKRCNEVGNLNLCRKPSSVNTEDASSTQFSRIKPDVPERNGGREGVRQRSHYVTEPEKKN